MAATQETGIREHECGRQKPFAEQSLLSIKVGENQIEKLRPLAQSGGDRSPFLRWHKERHQVKLPRPIHTLRITINVVGNAVFANDSAGAFAAERKFVPPQAVEQRDKPLPMWPW